MNKGWPVRSLTQGKPASSQFEKVFWLCCICCFGSMASMRACDSLLVSLGSTFNETTQHAARTISMFSLAYGVMQLLYGPLGDRYGKVKVVAIATLACSIGNLIAALSTRFPELVFARVASGVAAAGVIPLTMAWIGDNVPYERRQEVLAILLSATVFGMIAGQWGGALLDHAFGWRIVFIVLAATFLVGGTAACFAARSLVHPTLCAGTSAFQRVRIVLASPWPRTVLAITFTEGVFAFGSLAFIPTYLHVAFGISMPKAGAVVATYGLGGLIYSLCARLILRRICEETVACIGGASLAAGLFTLAASPFWQTAIPACLCAGFGFYALHNTLQAKATQMATQVRGTAVSLFSGFLFLGQSAGILATAWLSGIMSFRSVFLASGVGLFVLSLLLASLSRYHTSHSKRNTATPLD